MAHEKIVVGVDVGSTKIAVIAAQGSAFGSYQGSIEILGFSEVAVPLGAVVNGSVENMKQVGRAIREALAQAASRSDLDIGIVNVSFGGSHVKTSKHNDAVIRPSVSMGDEVTQRDVDQLVDDMYRSKTAQERDVLHVLPIDFVVDQSTGVREPVGRTGIKLGGNFLIVTADNQSIHRTKKSLLEADPKLKFDKFVYAPLAASMAVLTDNEMKAGIAMVDIGDHTTHLIIYHDRIIRHMASFPIGGRHITADLEEGCGIQVEHAEQLKRQYGVAVSGDIPLNFEILINFLAGRPPKKVLRKNVAMIIEERLKEIAAMVYADILNSGYREKLIGGIVLTGGSANIDEIEVLFEKVTDMAVRVGFPENLARTAKADAVSNSSFATAIGLAWIGLKTVDARIQSVCKPVEVSKAINGQDIKRREEKEKEEPRKPTGRFFWDNLLGKKEENTEEY